MADLAIGLRFKQSNLVEARSCFEFGNEGKSTTLSEDIPESLLAYYLTSVYRSSRPAGASRDTLEDMLSTIA